MGFRWLEVLEKDFDKAFVDLDILLGDIDEDQHDLVLEGREKLTRCDNSFCPVLSVVFHRFKKTSDMQVRK